jgi:hypothetical protein
MNYLAAMSMLIKNNKPVRYILWGIAAIILFFVLRKIAIGIRRTVPDKLREGGGDVPKEWIDTELQPIVIIAGKAFKRDWTVWAFGNRERCSVIHKLLALNDNQLRMVANRYSAVNHANLREDVESLTDSGCFLDFEDVEGDLYRRLVQINVTG